MILNSKLGWSTILNLNSETWTPWSMLTWQPGYSNFEVVVFTGSVGNGSSTATLSMIYSNVRNYLLRPDPSSSSLLYLQIIILETNWRPLRFFLSWPLFSESLYEVFLSRTASGTLHNLKSCVSCVLVSRMPVVSNVHAANLTRSVKISFSSLRTSQCDEHLLSSLPSLSTNIQRTCIYHAKQRPTRYVRKMYKKIQGTGTCGCCAKQRLTNHVVQFLDTCLKNYYRLGCQRTAYREW